MSQKVLEMIDCVKACIVFLSTLKVDILAVICMTDVLISVNEKIRNKGCEMTGWLHWWVTRQKPAEEL